MNKDDKFAVILGIVGMFLLLLYGTSEIITLNEENYQLEQEVVVQHELKVEAEEKAVSYHKSMNQLGQERLELYDIIKQQGMNAESQKYIDEIFGGEE